MKKAKKIRNKRENSKWFRLMENILKELTEKFSDINLSDLEDFENKYQIKMNTAGGPEMKSNVTEPSHRY